MQLTGAEIVIACLKEQGVDTVFGYPGGTILNIYDELYKHADEITHILTSHEQGAAHAADGYARSTGRVGVCMATSGPGATNLVTGIATAYMDSIPVVAITANVNLPALGKDSFQEVDIAGVTMPITKHGYIVKDVTKLADTIRKAFFIAKSGRPGPVLVDITKDVTANSCEYTYQAPMEPVYENKFTDADIDAVLALIDEAEKPYIYLGGGAILSNASEQVREFARKLDCPVCDTLMGKGAFDGYDDMYTGMIGMHGTKTSNLGVSECDLLIALGARFSDRVIGNPNTFASNAKIVHIDIDAAEVNKNIRTDASVIGDLKDVLSILTQRMECKSHPQWRDRIMQLKEKYPLSYNQSALTCPYVIEQIDKATQGNAIITTDVGQHQMWAAQYFPFSLPRTFITSGGLGTMGFGLGAAVGAAFGTGKRTILITGDGSFGMNLNDLATVKASQVPVVIVVLNNKVLGMVRQWQTLFYSQHYSHTDLEGRDTDFVKIAEAFGIPGFHIRNLEEMEETMAKAMAKSGPVLIEAAIDKDEFVLPMLPPGGSMDMIITEKEEL